MSIPLPGVARRLRKEHGVAISYGQVYRAVLDGRIPAEQGINGRCTVPESDLSLIARTFAPKTVAESPAAA